MVMSCNEEHGLLLLEVASLSCLSTALLVKLSISNWPLNPGPPLSLLSFHCLVITENNSFFSVLSSPLELSPSSPPHINYVKFTVEELIL